LIFKIFVLCLLIFLPACATVPAVLSPTPNPTQTATAIPAATVASDAQAALTETPEAGDGIFNRIRRSANALHLKCDPYEVIFTTTVKPVEIQHVAFFFRLKDKATGLVNPWSNVEMRQVGPGMFEYILQSKNIPNEARYWNAWLQYQFVALDAARQPVAHSAIAAQEISYSPGCP